jgi:DinB superfamily
MPEIKDYLSKQFLEHQGTALPEILGRLEIAKTEFAAALTQFEPAKLYVAAPDKWSVVQIADHVNTANTFFAVCLERTINGKSVVVMPKGQLSASGKAINPAGEPKNDSTLSELLSVHDATFEDFSRHAATIQARDGLNSVCVVQSFFGALSCLELLRLCSWHTRHHTAQIQELRSRIG